MPLAFSKWVPKLFKMVSLNVCALYPGLQAEQNPLILQVVD